MQLYWWCYRFSLSIVIKHSSDEKKTKKYDISLTKIIIKNYKSFGYMILLCFYGAVIAYFQITILPNIIKQTLNNWMSMLQYLQLLAL